jgi:uncharacterized protein YlxP (DUF503 family)
MANKRKSPDHPVAFFGKVTLEFYNNDDEEFKVRTLKNLAKELRKEFNVSCTPVESHQVENPEHGTLVISMGAASHERGMAEMDRVMKYLDEKAPARILNEEFDKAEIE